MNASERQRIIERLAKNGLEPLKIGAFAEPEPGPDDTRPRCLITGNPCGTDTWTKGTSCTCENCQAWLAQSDAEPDDVLVEKVAKAIFAK